MASKQTRLVIKNQINTDVTNMIVSDIDNHDWDGDSRPDHNIHGKGIKMGEEVNEREEINTAAKTHMVTIEFLLANGDSFKHRFNQGNALNSGYKGHAIYTGNRYDYLIHMQSYIPNLQLTLRAPIRWAVLIETLRRRGTCATFLPGWKAILTDMCTTRNPTGSIPGRIGTNGFKLCWRGFP